MLRGANAAEPVAPPDWLTGGGLEVWQRLAPRLTAMKLLAQVDAAAFGRYCRNFARWLKMQTALDEEGEVYESEGRHGKMKRCTPAFLISDRLERQLLAYEDRFGLNPAERQRLFAARSATTNLGDLFCAHAGDDDATPRREGPVGLLN